MTILIISHSKDVECTPMVVEAIQARGGATLCLNTDKFPSEEQVIFGNHQSPCLINQQGAHDLRTVSAVWNRRMRVGTDLAALLDQEYLAPSIDEATRTLLGFLGTTPAFVLDPVINVSSAGNKLLQLQLARGLGLTVPNTLITSDAEAVTHFAEANQDSVIAKMQAGFKVFRGGREHGIFTNTLSREDLADLSGLELCPMMFQASIPKKLELRVIVVGHQVYAAGVDSSANPETKEDWRRNGRALKDQWQPFSLPAEVERGLLLLMDKLFLNYGAIDLILTPDDRYIFLEVNPVGEFFWLDRYAGFNISAGLAALLLGKAQRRHTDLYPRPWGA